MFWICLFISQLLWCDISPNVTPDSPKMTFRPLTVKQELLAPEIHPPQDSVRSVPLTGMDRLQELLNSAFNNYYITDMHLLRKILILLLAGVSLNVVRKIAALYCLNLNLLI